jgi:flagellar basal-body rod protein FlgC
MSNAIFIALSGMAAAARRIAGVASNIANAGDLGPLAPAPGERPAYQPVDTVQVSLPDGGTEALTQPVSPATTPAYAPGSPVANQDGANKDGLVAAPNVDIAGQMIELISAREAYKANLKTVQVADDMQRRLLDVVS